MIADSTQSAFNRHMNAEMYSSNLYLAMSAWCESEGLRGCAHWMLEQSREEALHVMKFFDFVLARGGTVKLAAIEAPPSSWESPLAIFEAAHQHECDVTKRIFALVDEVDGVRDHAARVFLDWFVNEQVEEEATVADIVARLRRVGDDGRGILLIDQELQQRPQTGNAAE